MPTVRIFVSYAREECRYLGYRDDRGRWVPDKDSPRALIPWLVKSLRRRHDTLLWYDKKDLLPGDEFQRRIESAIDCAHVAVLLLSSGFLNSEFIDKVELPRIRARVQQGELRVVSILVEPCKWDDLDFIGSRLILPGKPTPLVDFVDSEKGWAHVRDEILRGVESVVEQVEQRLAGGKSDGRLSTSTAFSEARPVSATGRPVAKWTLWLHSAKRRWALHLACCVAGLIAVMGTLLYRHYLRLPVEHSDQSDTLRISVDINQTDGAVILRIPAGEFQMGSAKSDSNALADEGPQRRVYLDSYWIYKRPVTVAQYRKFCNAKGHPMPATPPWGWQDTHPIVSVTWHEATAYAAWAGARLPTEAQWEKAARGANGWVFPWGNTWNGAKCLNSVAKENPGSTVPVGSFPDGSSPYGVYDMAGHVWEWCADWYQKDYYRDAPTRNPTGPASGEYRILRGCPWDKRDPMFFRAAGRACCPPTGSNPNGGFRCVLTSRRP